MQGLTVTIGASTFTWWELIVVIAFALAFLLMFSYALKKIFPRVKIGTLELGAEDVSLLRQTVKDLSFRIKTLEARDGALMEELSGVRQTVMQTNAHIEEMMHEIAERDKRVTEGLSEIYRDFTLRSACEREHVKVERRFDELEAKAATRILH